MRDCDEFVERDVATDCIVLDRDFADGVEDRFEFDDVFADEVVIEEIVSDEDCEDRGDTERVGPGAYGQVMVGHRCSLGSLRVDHDHRPIRILRDLVEHVTSFGKPMAIPGFLPRNTATSVCSMSARVWAR